MVLGWGVGFDEKLKQDQTRMFLVKMAHTQITEQQQRNFSYDGKDDSSHVAPVKLPVLTEHSQHNKVSQAGVLIVSLVPWNKVAKQSNC